MKTLTPHLALIIALSLIIAACKAPTAQSTGRQATPSFKSANSVKFAAFNVSFAHDRDPSEHFEQWVTFMNMPHARQQALIDSWKAGGLNEHKYRQEHLLAERIIQIRNVAAIIQIVRPDVLLLNEFNNDGTGENLSALMGFQKNYLSISQSMNSVDGGDMLEPIIYPFLESYATNTGLPSGMNLANSDSGYDPINPNNAYGFGYYHGHYAFALMSKYEIDKSETRTFQGFKRKDLLSGDERPINPTINVCSSERKLPEGMRCGDTWFSADEWQNIRLSSKNHVDAPINIPTSSGIKTIHALLSHPTPPAFDTFSDNNKYRNSAENLFWLHYITGGDMLYDDNGIYGGLGDKSFVIMGDQNADTVWGRTTDERFNGIQDLMFHPRVNQAVSRINGEHLPISSGGAQEPNRRGHPHPSIRTATFGSRADYSVPSADLQVIDSGVYWPAEGEPGRLLLNDSRVGDRGTDKEVSSDHRLVWVTVALN
ncbi:endonuclease/exonuclease/phosphatase family protein [Ningiella sp. W23]|uniref:endonuclease/exonuclease/phosphatase family protein n=1 Tax=Ningiella sp. W23 TaxID=3023715 RepID=UPI00375646C4